ncbi:jg1333 [Pararge aegeria aegeria]|uniref:Jg1333 protein n=1 Tax=Pararge aegeria aegeria TaxID=348720 RepID=A0A8S4S060_9NEOP|nr:jg1333 [Pararge aegeria aegeria]
MPAPRRQSCEQRSGGRAAQLRAIAGARHPAPAAQRVGYVPAPRQLFTININKELIQISLAATVKENIVRKPAYQKCVESTKPHWASVMDYVGLNLSSLWEETRALLVGR